MENIKVIFFGRCSGKTSIIHRYVNGEFIREHIATIEDTYNTIVDLETRQVDLHIIDTTSEESLQDLKYSHFRDSDVFVFVYSVHDVASFNYVKKDIKYCMNKVESEGRKLGRLPTFIVVANKIDCNNRTVSLNEGVEIIEDINGKYPTGYYEVSALNNIKVDFLFESIAKGSAKKRSCIKEVQLVSKHNMKIELPPIIEIEEAHKLSFSKRLSQKVKCISPRGRGN
ncbi:hypothetical protein EIN_163930 [Entamoeba invadens IP1]|uniref:Uncharacterized protein n=2 Tax=Entamoeba invadens TaxID=33085 RepID=A0A0A1U459_ENTIV|nr:hypothetical protein EIN_163930 [Entamoeba invadens IP1]ELP89023.1 hypothetical protein EIN_163930 [Entamoeba invadens IP1]BAN40419.1 hypothetical protein, conserved [Entamoeba invadens]|eukprot:XP_004255794.1 hypothetical protein EIN_163930 [Entamoeba invadens IP1]